MVFLGEALAGIDPEGRSIFELSDTENVLNHELGYEDYHPYNLSNPEEYQDILKGMASQRLGIPTAELPSELTERLEDTDCLPAPEQDAAPAEQDTLLLSESKISGQRPTVMGA